MSLPDCTLVFDVGKTHVKTTLLDADGDTLDRRRAGNSVRSGPPYDHVDVEAIWEWLGEQVSELSESHAITSISIATHGATAALVDLGTRSLLLPIMDYEFEEYPVLAEDYDALRDPFSITGSPALPGGLNVGRQLHWQSTLLDTEQKARATILFYPQYWSWRLTGRACLEPTSLGCHTDIWNVRTCEATDLLSRFGLAHALPERVAPWEPLGTVLPDLARSWGLPPDCRVWPGLHDSNAGYAPYLRVPAKERPTIASTGTWVVLMDGMADLDTLTPERDMLVNIDAEGRPLATARYMGGREFGRVCELLDADIGSTFTTADIADIVSDGTLVLPCFAPGTGPYPEGYGRATDTLVNGKAAATLYSALMMADMATRLTPSTRRDLVVEGSFAQNDALCGLLAALLPGRTVRRHPDGSGVVDGCFAMTRWGTAPAPETGKAVAPLALGVDLAHYAAMWNERVNNRRGFQP